MKLVKKTIENKGRFMPIVLLGISNLLMINSCYHTETLKSKMNAADRHIELDSSETFQELGFFGRIKEEKWDEFVKAVQNNVNYSRQEPGNLAFNLYQSTANNHEAFWFERFESKQAHNSHKEQAHFKNAIAVIQQSLLDEATSFELKVLKEIPVQKAIVSQDPSSNFNMIVLFDVKPEKRQKFIDIMEKFSQVARSAPGNLEFNLYQYIDNSNKFVLIEGWQNSDHHKVYWQQEYSKKLNQQLLDVLVSNNKSSNWLVKDISVDNQRK